ncbi:hypothetical protein PIN31115_03564 [Pandoraea iniqua]|uniref:Uncharacterized protein n=1 Tax=Pandoraea iniqua TaxID=2508288 RepID=A0A5E4X0I3_9BURK|nr:hypothetical protein PIN31115_03564 [Pandoraea iniqua]
MLTFGNRRCIGCRLVCRSSGTGGGEPFVVFQPQTVFNRVSGGTALPTLTISDNTISWTNSGAPTQYPPNVKGLLFYGVR